MLLLFFKFNSGLPNSDSKRKQKACYIWQQGAMSIQGNHTLWHLTDREIDRQKKKPDRQTKATHILKWQEMDYIKKYFNKIQNFILNYESSYKYK
jgi:hypothetical protein